MKKRDKLAFTGLCIGYGAIGVSSLLGDIVLGTCALVANMVFVIVLWGGVCKGAE